MMSFCLQIVSKVQIILFTLFIAVTLYLNSLSCEIICSCWTKSTAIEGNCVSDIETE